MSHQLRTPLVAILAKLMQKGLCEFLSYSFADHLSG